MFKRQAAQLLLFTVVTGCFILGAHGIYSNIVLAWNKAQLQDLATRSILRAELSTDRAVQNMAKIQAQGLTSCSPAVVDAYRKNIFALGSLKDIRLRSAGQSCAGFNADQLARDLDSADRWQKSSNGAIQLGVLQEAEGQSLSVLWQAGSYDLMSVVSTGDLLYDMVPSALRPHLAIEVSLIGGKRVAFYRPETDEKQVAVEGDRLQLTASSSRYPMIAQLSIERAALGVWNGNGSLVVDLLVCLFGLFLGGMASKLAFPPLGPIDHIDQAIKDGEFHPHYQTIVDLRTGQMVGFEMLARWTRPDGEIVSPGHFIPLVENFGRVDALLFDLMRSAGEEVGEKLCADASLKMSFNITPGQFLDPTFLPRLMSVVTLVGLPVSNLVAEITERQEIADLDEAQKIVARYRQRGLRIAIDDAGTGHNGLSSIQKLNVSTIKLDKIFIDGIADDHRSRLMVEMLANLAHQYQMITIAEGIETPEQGRIAQSLGIQQGQGYHFSRPVPAENLLQLLDEQAAATLPEALGDAENASEERANIVRIAS